MSPETTHKLMGFYMEVLIYTRCYTLVHGFCFFNLFPIYRVYRVKAFLAFLWPHKRKTGQWTRGSPPLRLWLDPAACITGELGSCDPARTSSGITGCPDGCFPPTKIACVGVWEKLRLTWHRKDAGLLLGFTSHFVLILKVPTAFSSTIHSIAPYEPEEYL